MLPHAPSARSTPATSKSSSTRWESDMKNTRELLRDAPRVWETKARLAIDAHHGLGLKCSWVDTHEDEWGMACSEPDVPTTFEVPCSDAAAYRIVAMTMGPPVEGTIPGIFDNTAYWLTADHLCLFHADAHHRDLTSYGFMPSQQWS